VPCVRTGTGALTGLWLRDGVAWLTFWLRTQIYQKYCYTYSNWFFIIQVKLEKLSNRSSSELSYGLTYTCPGEHSY